MIGSLRRKFISISMISIFIVFSCIFISLMVFTKIQTNRSVDMLVDTISSNDGVFLNLTHQNSVCLSRCRIRM